MKMIIVIETSAMVILVYFFMITFDELSFIDIGMNTNNARIWYPPYLRAG